MLHSFHVVASSCCTHFVLHFPFFHIFRVALFIILHINVIFSYYSFSNLFIFNFQFGSLLLTCFLFYYFHGALSFLYATYFSHCTLPFRTHFMLHFFPVGFFSCCTPFIIHSPMAVYHAALISWRGLLRLQFFLLRFFRVADFNFYVLFFYVALCQFCFRYKLSKQVIGAEF